VARALHASNRADFREGMRSVGKRAGDESGKHPVNEIGEEIFPRVNATRASVTRGCLSSNSRYRAFSPRCGKRSYDLSAAARRAKAEAIRLSIMPRDELLR
jgi:hypothetical protein